MKVDIGLDGCPRFMAESPDDDDLVIGSSVAIRSVGDGGLRQDLVAVSCCIHADSGGHREWKGKGRVYVFVREGGRYEKWKRFAELSNPYPSDFDTFGAAVDICQETGRIAVAGFGDTARRDMPRGSTWVHIFDPIGGGPGLPVTGGYKAGIAQLGVPAGSSNTDWSIPSLSVAFDGDLLVCGHPTGGIGRLGTAAVWRLQHNEVIELRPMFGATPTQPTGFGASVDISGTEIAVGAPAEKRVVGADTESGTVYLFRPTSSGGYDSSDTSATEQLMVKSKVDADKVVRYTVKSFGCSVRYSSARRDLAVGAAMSHAQGHQQGSAYHYERVGGDEFEAPVRLVGDGRFGRSCSIDDDPVHGLTMVTTTGDHWPNSLTWHRPTGTRQRLSAATFSRIEGFGLPGRQSGLGRSLAYRRGVVIVGQNRPSTSGGVVYPIDLMRFS